MGKTRDLFKKLEDIKGAFHATMGTIKNRNSQDLTEAEEIKKRWKEYTELRADTLKPYSQKTSQSNHTRTTACLTQRNQAMPVGQPKTGGSWWKGLTECGPLEKGMASHFSILALRTP